MKSIKTLSSPKAFKLLGDETRRRMLFLLRAKEMSACEIADELDLTPQAVYHHLKKMVEGEMVEVTREERHDHLIESYYRATAESFQFVMGKTSQSAAALKEQIATALSALKRVGFNVEYDDETVAELVKLQTQTEECCSAAKFEDAISALEDVDLVTKIMVQEYASLISISDKDWAKEEDLRRKTVDLLKSLLKKEKTKKLEAAPQQ